MDIRPSPDQQGATAPPLPPSRRGRGIARGFVQGTVLIGLAWLTVVDATTSRPLREASEAEGRGEYPAATRAAIEHLARRPWSGEAARIVARCLSRLDFARRAEPYYARGVPLSVEDLRYRAYGLTRANLREAALRAFDEVLAREPGDLASLRLKAGLLISVERWDAVATIGEKLAVASRGPVEVETPVAVGDHWTFRPRTVASISTVGATLEGIAAHNLGESGAAVAAYERVLALDPGLASMPLDRRLFRRQFGEDLLAIGRAADLAALADREDPGRSDPELVVLLARAKGQLGAVDEAEAAWKRALELSPGYSDGWLALGRIEAGRGREEEAARLLEKAAALAPDSVDAAYNLGLVYRRLGREEQAKNWERKAATLRALGDEKEKAKSRPKPKPKLPASGSSPPDTGT